MKTGYIDCFSGVSGDMLMGALLDAGLPFEALKARLATLPLSNYRLEERREARSEIFGTRFEVKVKGGTHVHRNLDAIREIIQKGDLTETVKEKCVAIFQNLATVEGRIHSLPPEQIHFHEVGAVDSIIDIVGAVYGFESMALERIYASPLPLGSGFAQTQHGRIPIPAPATVALAKGIPVLGTAVSQEMVTPTGAALIKALAHDFGRIPPMVIDQVGYGVGSRDLPDRPNLLRILIGQETLQETSETVVLLETNLDDISPEWLGHLMDRLFEAGALDVVFCPVYMKKNRPGIQVQVLGRPHQKDPLSAIMFRETGTLGIRSQFIQREILKRATEEVHSPWGKIRVKRITEADGTPVFFPEYEACRAIASKHGRPLREIFSWVMGLNKPK